MLGIKPNRIYGQDDPQTPIVQNTGPSTNSIELPAVDQPEEITEIPRENYIPGESNEDIFGDINAYDEEVNQCPCKPNKLFGKFKNQQYEDDAEVADPTVAGESSKMPLVYVGMGLALLKYLF